MVLTVRHRLVWIDPDTGAIRCWLNKYPNAWVKAGEDGLIADGRGPSDSIFLAVSCLSHQPYHCSILQRRTLLQLQANSGAGYEW